MLAISLSDFQLSGDIQRKFYFLFFWTQTHGSVSVYVFQILIKSAAGKAWQTERLKKQRSCRLLISQIHCVMIRIFIFSEGPEFELLPKYQLTKLSFFFFINPLSASKQRHRRQTSNWSQMSPSKSFEIHNYWSLFGEGEGMQLIRR